jgi:hypothetical protein
VTGWLYRHPWTVGWVAVVAYIEALYLTVLR